MTLKDFFDSKENLGIHCDNFEKAKTLLEAFDELGKKWCRSENYKI